MSGVSGAWGGGVSVDGAVSECARGGRGRREGGVREE